eukprot:TRINITY_DN5854_c0_g1_i2.p1 TRINITY_DN5854_c0_g1~~TRINITY_DN5854_c0_g1_i2.p1  ORF type:complete len:119 (+),score=43.32 TRINITY_DN5854_c0_g1_i2:163-519(+)
MLRSLVGSEMCIRDRRTTQQVEQMEQQLAELHAAQSTLRQQAADLCASYRDPGSAGRVRLNDHEMRFQCLLLSTLVEAMDHEQVELMVEQAERRGAWDQAQQLMNQISDLETQLLSQQ